MSSYHEMQRLNLVIYAIKSHNFQHFKTTFSNVSCRTVSQVHQAMTWHWVFGKNSLNQWLPNSLTSNSITNPMMTSSNGNIFRVTGHLCGEFTGPRWIPRTMAKWRGAGAGEAGDLRRHHAHHDVIVMHNNNWNKHRPHLCNESRLWYSLVC